MITRLRYPKGYQFFDANGAPLALGNLYYYAAGTTTPQDTYSDSAGTILNTNPLVLDGSGRVDVDVYLGSTANYKEVLVTASTTVSPWPDDNIPLAAQADWNATSGPNQILKSQRSPRLPRRAAITTFLIPQQRTPHLPEIAAPAERPVSFPPLPPVMRLGTCFSVPLAVGRPLRARPVQLPPI